MLYLISGKIKFKAQSSAKKKSRSTDSNFSYPVGRDFVQGGFAGNETNIEQRAKFDKDGNGKIEAWEFINETILSGDIDGVEDVWTKVNGNCVRTWRWSVTGNEENCYRVVYCKTRFTYNTNFDGFSVRGGNANVENNG